MNLFEEIVKSIEAQITVDENCRDDKGHLFKKPSEKELEVLTNLYQTYSHSSSVYNEEELETLKSYTLPEKVVEFYKEFSPSVGIFLDCGVTLLSLEDIKRENSEFAPGAYIVKYGVVTIATTTGGNAICIDLNALTDGEPGVLIADQSILNSNYITVFPNGVIQEYELSYEVIRKFAPEISNTFTGFLKMLANREVDDVENYLSEI
jgi:hypothetical protein